MHAFLCQLCSRILCYGVLYFEAANVYTWMGYILESPYCCGRSFHKLGKRGIEKQPFQLPNFIAATGIKKIR